MENKSILIIPIWLLYNVETTGEVKFDQILAENIKEYSIEHREHLYSVLKTIDQDSDFIDIIEKTPNNGELKFSNEEIYNYLLEFKEFMESEIYKILKN